MTGAVGTVVACAAVLGFAVGHVVARRLIRDGEARFQRRIEREAREQFNRIMFRRDDQ